MRWVCEESVLLILPARVTGIIQDNTKDRENSLHCLILQRPPQLLQPPSAAAPSRTSQGTLWQSLPAGKEQLRAALKVVLQQFFQRKGLFDKSKPLGWVLLYVVLFALH